MAEYNEFVERKKKEMAFFQAEREKAVLSLAEKPQLMKTYLELSTRVDESPLNTVWVAVKMPEAVDLKTYQEWKAIGCEVRRDAKGLNVIHASSKVGESTCDES